MKGKGTTDEAVFAAHQWFVKPNGEVVAFEPGTVQLNYAAGGRMIASILDDDLRWQYVDEVEAGDPAVVAEKMAALWKKNRSETKVRP